MRSVVALACVLSVAAACGARSALDGAGPHDDVSPVLDAGHDVDVDAPSHHDAPSVSDVSVRDVAHDAPVADLCSPDGAPFTVATGVDGTDYAIVVDASFVYFSGSVAGTSAPLRRAPKGGGVAVTLAPDGGQHYVTDGAFLYWGDNTTMRRIGIPVGIVETLGPSRGWPQALGVDDASVVWAALPPGGVAAVMRMPKVGGAPAQIPVGPANSVAIDANNLYWVDASAQLFAMPKAGGAALLLSDARGALNIAQDDAFLYYLTPTGGSLARVAKAGGPVVTLVQAASAFSIAVDGDSVYWANPFASTVSKVKKTGGAATQLAKGKRPSAASIAVDENCVYWIDGSNQADAEIVRVHK